MITSILYFKIDVYNNKKSKFDLITNSNKVLSSCFILSITFQIYFIQKKQTLHSTQMNFNTSNLTISNTTLSIHKNATIISEKAKKISKKLGIIDEEFYTDHSTMTNYLYTNSPTDKMVNILVTYNVLYFLDDFFGEDTNDGSMPSLEKILEIWNGEKEYNCDNIKINRLYKSINFISEILRNDSPDSFFKKYTNSIVEHLSFSLIEKKYNTVDEYISIRLMTGGMYPVIDLIEYANSNYLTEEIINDNEISLKKLSKQCALIGALSNDLFSYAKEKHSDYNLINAYLITGEATNYIDAVSKSISKVNIIHANFEVTINSTRQKLISYNLNKKLIIESYLNSLETIVSSSYHWQKDTNRYKHPDNVFEDLKVTI